MGDFKVPPKHHQQEKIKIRIASQNLRGMTLIKLEEIIKELTKEKNPLYAFLGQESWYLTPEGVEIAEMRGCTIIHAGEKMKASGRGRNGVCIILGPQAPKDWAAEGKKVVSKSSRTLEIVVRIQQKSMTLAAG